MNCLNLENVVSKDFRYDYAPSKLKVDDLTRLFELCKQYRESQGPIKLTVTYETQVNLLISLYFEDGRKSLKYVREQLADSGLLDYLDVYINQAEERGIKEVLTFTAWIHGNDNTLPNYPADSLRPHTHPYRAPTDTSPVNTYTIFSELRTVDSITGKFWGIHFEDIDETLPLQFMAQHSKLSKLITSDSLKSRNNDKFTTFWTTLRQTTTNEEHCAMFPGPTQQMILDFNSRNWLHGIENVGNNLYLLILFDDYIL